MNKLIFILPACLIFVNTILNAQGTADVELFLKVEGVIQNDMDDVKFYFIAENENDDKSDDDTIDLNFIGYKFSVDTLPGEGSILFTFRGYEIEITEISFKELKTVERIEIEMWTNEKSIKKKLKEFRLSKPKCDTLNLLAKYTLDVRGHGENLQMGIIIKCEMTN